MPDIAPAELAALVDHAERPRSGDWSLRAALVRLAQFRPGHVRDLMEVVRRLEQALHAQRRRLLSDGPALWAALDGGAAPADAASRSLIALLEVARELDGLADRVVAWAEDRAGPMPDDDVAQVAASLSARLDELGVAREERTRARS